MPQSLSNVLVHVVFSTKHRSPSLSSKLRAELFPYLTGVLRNHECPSLQVGGVEDHLHLLFNLSRTMAVAEIVKELKTGSSKWIKTKSAELASFSWQAGYGAFSIGAEEAEGVTEYVQNQEQ